MFGLAKKVNTSTISTVGNISIVFIQISGIFMEYQLAWPEEVKSIIDWISSIMLFNLSDVLVSPECSLSWGWNEKWIFSSMKMKMIV